jgi:energy-coupling factor transporter ATP-binding protein EcfA2
MNYKSLLENEDNPQLKLAYEFVKYTNKNIFLTGKAGTGKTTFLKALKELLPKRMIVVAPTGVAAINAGGVTIHSFFQLPFGVQIPEISNKKNKYRFNNTKIDIVKSLDLLIIDEISMVRADLLDSIDEVLRRYANRDLPFGGIQLLMIGDLQQLAPVVKQDEWELIKDYYENMYFFSSRTLNQTDYVSIELEHVYRQKDNKFINILNKIRDNNLDDNTLTELNKNYNESFVTNIPEEYIVLTTHNYKADRINNHKLQQIKENVHEFEARIEGNFPENSFPLDYNINFKVGAQVMFVKNDSSGEKMYYNGKIGVIEKFEEDIIYVKCKDIENLIPVIQEEWENVKYILDDDSKEIKPQVEGKFIQYPLKLAWAITIHKSQGLTFEKAIIDGERSFAHGQVYVALSRCSNMEGMFLNSLLTRNSIKSDIVVSEFNKKITYNKPNNQLLEESKNGFQKQLILELFDFKKLAGHLGYCLKIIRENQMSIQGNLYETLVYILDIINNEIILISKKFENQIDKFININPDIENNHKLQERIKKGSEYFHEKLIGNIETKIMNIEIESDNKNLTNSLNRIINRIENEFVKKLTCLSGVKDGFSLEKYLEIRAKSNIVNIKTKKTDIKLEIVSNTIKNKELYNDLKKWRDKKAEKDGLPKYMIVQLNTINTISELLPKTVDDLKKIKGIGKKKLSKYAEDILKIVEKYIENNKDLENEKINFDEISESKKIKNTETKKLQTHLHTLELYQNGNSIDKISDIRRISKNTIEEHIAKCIEEDLVDTFEFVNENRFNIIKEVFEDKGLEFLKPTKEVLGDDYTYSELKFVRSHMVKNRS